eukprot:6635432-Prymnesium_polylepis.5
MRLRSHMRLCNHMKLCNHSFFTQSQPRQGFPASGTHTAARGRSLQHAKYPQRLEVPNESDNKEANTDLTVGSTAGRLQTLDCPQPKQTLSTPSSSGCGSNAIMQLSAERRCAAKRCQRNSRPPVGAATCSD